MSVVGWLEKLKGIFGIQITSPLLSIKFANNSYNNTNVHNVPYYYDESKGELILNLNEMKSAQKVALKEVIAESIGEGNKLLQTETEELLQNLYRYKRENTNDKQILEFFRPIIPPTDIEALEAALYLRIIFKKRGDIQKLKSDIINSFGSRGNNITNLCSAGYFEGFLMPLYNSNKEAFKKLYEAMVGQSAVAFFVHHNMSQVEIAKGIKKKLSISKKYGIGFVHIHGIGVENVSKIKKCINEERKSFDFFDRNTFEKDNIIVIELLLK